MEKARVLFDRITGADFPYAAPSKTLGLHGLTANEHGELSIDGKDIVLKATGDDPTIIFPGISYEAQRTLLVKIELTSPRETSAQVETRTVAGGPFVASPVYPVKAGDSIFYFEAIAPQEDGSIRLHLGKGTVGTEIRIHSILAGSYKYSR